MLEWAVTGNGDYFCWLTDRQPDAWDDGRVEPSWQYYDAHPVGVGALWKGCICTLRDLTTHWTEEDLIRVVDDDNRMKKQIRQLTNDNSDLTNKLAAARDNARFADRRIAALEAEYATAILL